MACSFLTGHSTMVQWEYLNGEVTVLIGWLDLF